ncbi:protein PYRICULARIA ORYZAE RESISTANCE 21-like [Lolium perenne]|uniref:protein PYRICULARIA ORYZAE RESISTANCE 21-like n=1 Tax=Lolium perenne TaxID=4522 RepID=UPI003A99C92A
MQMPITKIKVDLDCSPFHNKNEKLLGRIREKGEFVIDEIEYDEKKNKVIVTGFSTLIGSPALQGHQGFVIKEIEIVEPPPLASEPPNEDPTLPESVVEEPSPPEVVEPEPMRERRSHQRRRSPRPSPEPELPGGDMPLDVSTLDTAAARRIA